jgi:hypothetical protein
MLGSVTETQKNALKAHTEKRVPKEKRRPLLFALSLCAIAFLYLYTNLFGVSGIPIFAYGDESFFWEYASRMLSGQVFLRDFHQFTPPGVDLFYLWVFRLFGESVQSTSWAVLFLGLALTIVCYLVARQMMKWQMATVAALACLVLLYGDTFDATHHWFSSFFALLAILVLCPERSLSRIAAASMFIALSSFCTQTTGAMTLAACCISIVWERRFGKVSWKLVGFRLALLMCGALLIWALLSWRFIVAAGFRHYWYFQVTYPRKYIGSPHDFLNPHLGQVGGIGSAITFARGSIVYIALILISPLVTWYCTRQKQWPANEGMPLVLLGTLGTLMMLEVITRLIPNRMDAAAMPSVILGIWLISRMEGEGRKMHFLGYLLLSGLMLEQSIKTQLHRYQSLTFPGGTALLRADDAEEASWLVEHTRPGDYFFEVAFLHYYGLLKLQHPVPVDTLLPLESTRPEWVIETVDNLARKDVRYILWSPRMQLRHVRDLNSPPPDHLDPLRMYMSAHYRMVKVFKNGDEIWERRPLRTPPCVLVNRFMEDINDALLRLCNNKTGAEADMRIGSEA